MQRLLPLVLLAACRAPLPEHPPYAVPEDRGDGWRVAHAARHDVDAAPLAAMLSAFDDGSVDRVDYVGIAKDGVLVLDAQVRTELDLMDEGFGNDTLEVHSLQSASKSFASALVGVAIQQGHIASVQDELLDYFPEYDALANPDPRKEAWTIEDFLTMRTGLEWDEWGAPYTEDANTLGRTYREAQDYVKYLFDLPIANEPGSTFAYCSIGSVTLSALAENASGVQLEELAEEHLFGPLGIESARILETPTGRAHLGGGLLLSGRDMGKFGQLFLQDGVWDGERLLPEGWVRDSFAQHVTFDGPARKLGVGYGYQWWLEQIPAEGEVHELFAAKGYGGQYIYVWPAMDAVISFQGSNWALDGSGGPDPAPTLLREYVLPAFGVTPDPSERP